MARKNNSNHDHGDTHLIFENAELQDRISRGNTELRRLELRIERLTRAGAAMYDALIHKQVAPHVVADWEKAVK